MTLNPTSDLNELRAFTTERLRSRLTFVSREPGFYTGPNRALYLAHMAALRAVIAERESPEPAAAFDARRESV